MLSFAKRKARVALTGLHSISIWLKSNEKAGFRLFILLTAVLAGMVLVMPMNFGIREGDLSYQLAKGSLDGGHVQIPLGPAGWLNYHTHVVPINLKLNLVLDRENLTTGQDLPERFNSGYKRFRYDAVEAFVIFIITRIGLIVWIGVAVGITVSNGGRRWWKNAIIGAICFGLLSGGLIAVSFLSLNRHPELECVGLSQDLRTGFRAVMTLSKNYPLDKNLLQNLVDGAAVVAGQMSETTDDTGTSILFASDFQGNSAGMKLLDGIVRSKGNISAVVIAGDIVQSGEYFDTYLFKHSISFDKAKTPIWYIDGNHENWSSDEALKDLGYQRLDNQLVSIGDVTVIGQSDPDGLDIGLKPTELELHNSSIALADRYKRYSVAPNIVVVHELAQAKDTIEAAKITHRPLTIVYGHDHLIGHSSDGLVNLIDCGTSGAWGFEKINKDPKTPYTFQILDFSSGPNPKLTGVWTLVFYGLNDGTSVRYYPIN